MVNIIIPASLSAQPLSFYLATEEWVATHMSAGDYMFTWIVEPTVIIGRNQVAGLEADITYCRDHGIRLFRRKSGGGCVYADPNNLMISYITADTDVARVFSHYLGDIARSLRVLGIDVTPSGRNDLMLGDRKVSGNSFYRMASRSIVHGTLLWEVDTETMSRAITPSRSKLMSRKVKSVGARVTGLADSMPDKSLSDIASHLTTSLCSSSLTLSPSDIEGIGAIQQRYHDPAWTFGHKASSKAGEAMRLPTRAIDGAGVFDITLLLDCDGMIADADITGDFFLLADLDSSIIDRIKGVRHAPEELSQVLADTDVSMTIAGLSTPQLISLLSLKS